MKASNTKISPFVISLTGTIGTGKSLVRKMLEHKGALTIDADQLAHAAYSHGTIGFHALVNRFGNEILDENGQIDRKRLGELVFRNPQALIELETLIHPLVTQAVNRVIDLSPLPIIVIEAIKLLESNLKERCDAVWAVNSPADAIYKRLSETRGMDREHVNERVNQQSVWHIGETCIDSIIPNEGDINDLWTVVSARWDDLSKNSIPFRAALTATRELMKPFQKYLVQPDGAVQAQAFFEINLNGLFFLPAKNLSTEYPQNTAADFDAPCLETTSYKYYLWRVRSAPEKNLTLISDIDNFTATAAVSECKFDADQFRKIISMVEDFSRLHLCEKLCFPFKKEVESPCDLFGLENYLNSSPPAPDLSTLGYNLLCKQLRPTLDLFREN